MGFESSTNGSRKTASEFERGAAWYCSTLVTLPTPTTASRRQAAISVREVVCQKHFKGRFRTSLAPGRRAR